MKARREIYYVSENTGLLSKDTGKSLICQFPDIVFKEEVVPFIRTVDDAKKTLDEILAKPSESPPIIFSTIFSPELNDIFDHEDVIFFNVCEPFLAQLEIILDRNAMRTSGTSRNLDRAIMTSRVDAIHYTIAHDDGTALREYREADLIIVGVSRAGKTPISVFLATQMGIKTANYPLVESDLAHCHLPSDIISSRQKVIGLSISPEVLKSFREQRYPGSTYARIETCKKELIQARRIFEKYNFPVVYSDGRSIEETATQVATELTKEWNPVF